MNYFVGVGLICFNKDEKGINGSAALTTGIFVLGETK
jgi:hypothetical protein